MSNKEAPPLDYYLEQGIRRGGFFVQRAIAKIPSDVPRPFDRLGPRVARVRQFLIENDLIVSSTDKNLGLAVSKRSWIVEQSEQLLNNTNDYEQIHPLQAQEIFRTQCKCM